MSRPVLWFVVAIAVLAHAWAVLDVWQQTESRKHAADFASYYYAVQVAADGGNPYDNDALVRMAKAEGTRAAVYPYLYPPPFLLTMVWALPLPLYEAYLVWFWIDEAFALLVALILWRWWKGMGTPLPVAILVTWGAWTIFAHNHHMGQVNLMVLALTLGGLWATERDRETLGGALVGAACLFKMSPALFLLWWVTHRRYRAPAAAVASAVVLSVLALPLVDRDVQLHFYREVLPTFGNGEYGGLSVRINLFGNHSLPALYDRWFPGDHKVLTPAAQGLSNATALAIAAGMAWGFRKPAADVWALAGQVGAVCVALLLIPVYTYEHHLVWAVPALIATVCALFAGRLPAWSAVGLAYACFVLWFDLGDLHEIEKPVGRAYPWLGTFVREAKLIGLLVLGATSAWLGVGRGARYVAANEVDAMGSMR